MRKKYAMRDHEMEQLNEDPFFKASEKEKNETCGRELTRSG